MTLLFEYPTSAGFLPPNITFQAAAAAPELSGYCAESILTSRLGAEALAHLGGTLESSYTSSLLSD